MLTAIVLITGCSDDPKKSFEALVANAEKQINGAEVTISQPELGITDWYRRKVYAANFHFDVRSTTSLVSPFMGEIAFDCSVRGRKGSSKADVTTGPDTFDQGTPSKATYAFQSSKWVFKGLTNQGYDNTVPWTAVESDGSTSGTCYKLLPK